MAASHSCPHFPSHHAFLLDFPAICIGRSLPFFVGCHSAARLGFTVTRSLTPSTTCLFEQWGHPIPLLLFPITASHSCPHVPFHQTFRLDPAVTCAGLGSGAGLVAKELGSSPSLSLSGLQGSYINCEVTLTVNGKSKTFVPKAICNGKVSDGIYVRPRIG